MTDTDFTGLNQTDPTAASAAALGAGGPIGGSSDDVLARLRAQQKPVVLNNVGKLYATPAQNSPVAAPKNPEDNLTIARRQREQGENPSGDPNAKNPYSSASGADQIIDSTWLDLMNKYHPEMVRGQTQQQILAMKVDPNLSHEMAAQYDKDNAAFLASNGIAPTPNFINAAYRAGPQGAMAIIQAARQNPGTLVKDVVPAVATPGNNGAGNMTVGQFLLNPYARGPGAQDGTTPQQLFTLARGNQILADIQKQYDEGEKRVSEIDKDYSPLKIGKPPAPPVTDPLAQFSSLAGVFATIAAGFSRTPMIAAMNGLAGAMNAAKKSDWDTYQAQYDQFKTNSDLAIKAHEMHSADIKDALEMMTKNIAAGTAMMQVTMALSDDEEMRKHMEAQDHIGAADLAMRRERLTQEMKDALPKTMATAELTAAMTHRDEAVRAQAAARASGDPEKIKQADEIAAQADANVTQAANRVAEVERAYTGGGTAAGISAPFPATVNGKPTTLVYDKNTRQTQYLDGTPLPPNASVMMTGRETATSDAEARVKTLALGEFQKVHGRDPDPNSQSDQLEMARMETEQKRAASASGGRAGISGLVTMLVDGKPTLVRYDKNKAEVQFPDGTPVPSGTSIAPAPKTAPVGSPGEERSRRFDEMKAAQQAAGTYTDDTEVYRAVDHQMAEDKQTAISDEAAKLAADLALKTGHPPAWMGRSQASLTKFLDAYAKEAKEQGLGPDEIASNQVKFASQLAEGRTLGTMTARVDFGAKELDVALPQAMEASERVYRPGFKKIADIQQAIQGQTSDPDLLEFAQFNQQVISAYAQMMGRGGLSTVHAMDRAEGLLSTATSQAGYMRQLDTLHKEVQIILYGTQAAKDQLRQEIGGGGAATPAPVLTGVPRGGEQTSGSSAPPPPEAIRMLKNDPSSAAHFDEIFGAGSAARVLGR